MPPPNRLAPPLNNSLAYSVPRPLEPRMLPPPPSRFVPRRELENLSIGLGRGAVTGMESLEQLLTQPVATAQALIEAARQLGTDPRIVLDMLRAARQKAMSGSLGLGELIGENVTPGMRGAKPPVVRKIFVGKGSKTWNAAAAKRAEELEAQGVSPEKIWQQTGTFRSPDGQLRQEIADLPATWQGKKIDAPASYHLEHPELYEAYPDIGSAWMQPRLGQKGSYQFVEGGNPSELLKIGTDNPRSIALHELQHAVQKREGFARGGQPFSETGGTDLTKSVDLINEFSTKFDRLRELKRQLPRDQQPRGSKLIGWAYREFDIDELFDDIEDNVKDSKIRQEMLDILEELDVKRENLFGIRTGEIEKEAQLRNYQRLAGEAEARAVETRASYTPSMLKNRYPLFDYDVPLNELIIKTK